MYIIYIKFTKDEDVSKDLPIISKNVESFIQRLGYRILSRKAYSDRDHLLIVVEHSEGIGDAPEILETRIGTELNGLGFTPKNIVVKKISSEIIGPETISKLSLYGAIIDKIYSIIEEIPQELREHIRRTRRILIHKYEHREIVTYLKERNLAKKVGEDLYLVDPLLYSSVNSPMLMELLNQMEKFGVSDRERMKIVLLLYLLNAVGSIDRAIELANWIYGMNPQFVMTILDEYSNEGVMISESGIFILSSDALDIIQSIKEELDRLLGHSINKIRDGLIKYNISWEEISERLSSLAVVYEDGNFDNVGLASIVDSVVGKNLDRYILAGITIVLDTIFGQNQKILSEIEIRYAIKQILNLINNNN